LSPGQFTTGYNATVKNSAITIQTSTCSTRMMNSTATTVASTNPIVASMVRTGTREWMSPTIMGTTSGQQNIWDRGPSAVGGRA
jgi:hypothetical protein